jgi:hypothetical protein
MSAMTLWAPSSPHHRDHRDLADHHRSSGVVRIGQLGVETLEHALRDAGRMADPDGCREHENVGVQDGLADLGPLVTVTHIGLDTRLNRVVDHPQRFGLHAGFPQVLTHVLGHQGAARRRRAWFQTAHQRHGAQRSLGTFGHAPGLPDW